MNRPFLCIFVALIVVLLGNVPVQAQPALRVTGVVHNGRGAGLGNVSLALTLRRSGSIIGTAAANSSPVAPLGTYSAVFGGLTTAPAASDALELQVRRLGFTFQAGQLRFSSPLSLTTSEAAAALKPLDLTATVVPAAPTFGFGPPGGFPAPGTLGVGPHALTVTFREPIISTPTFQVVVSSPAGQPPTATGALARVPPTTALVTTFVASSYTVAPGARGTYRLLVPGALSVSEEPAPVTATAAGGTPDTFTLDTEAPTGQFRVLRNGTLASSRLGVGVHTLSLDASEALSGVVRAILFRSPSPPLTKTLSLVTPVPGNPTRTYSVSLRVGSTTGTDLATAGTISVRPAQSLFDLAGNPMAVSPTATFEIRPTSSAVQLSYLRVPVTLTPAVPISLATGPLNVLPAGGLALTATFVDPPAPGNQPTLQFRLSGTASSGCFPAALVSSSNSLGNNFGFSTSLPDNSACEDARATLRLSAIDDFGNAPRFPDFPLQLDPRAPRFFLAAP
ncbi:MAG: hypothetical protein HY814_10370, partial [Candidatus Riflebacteria bacterium]|nr:hypothetical protein [Candidatus Riflebacteria bacterium]